LSFAGNSINLFLPKIIAKGIDAFTHRELDMNRIIAQFLGAAFAVFLFTYAMSFVQTYASEKVARDLRTRLAERISRQSYTFLQKTSSAQLLTNLTADVD